MTSLTRGFLHKQEEPGKRSTGWTMGRGPGLLSPVGAQAWGGQPGRNGWGLPLGLPTRGTGPLLAFPRGSSPLVLGKPCPAQASAAAGPPLSSLGACCL